MKKTFPTFFAAMLLFGCLGIQVHAADTTNASTLEQSAYINTNTNIGGATAAAASPIADKTIVEIKDNRYYVHKTFERTLDTDETDPSVLKEEPFELDGYLYAFFDLQKEAVPVVERKMVLETVTMETETDDASAILQQIEADIPYETDGFEGTLTLNHASVNTVVKEYKAKSFTLTDTQTFNGLSDTDPIAIPKTIVKSGVTLKLQDVNWSVQETTVVGYDAVPSMYSAAASYSGSYSKNVPVSYATTAQYTGEVGRSHIEKIIYTVTYLGEAVAVNEAQADSDGGANSGVLDTDASSLPPSTTFGWIAAFSCIFIAGAGAVVFFYLRRNVAIYAKENDSYKLLTWQYVKKESPAVDLRRAYISTPEAAVCVKQALANRLFGRHITTIISNNKDMKCLVDKQGADFWYIVDMSDNAEPGDGASDV